MRCCKSKEVRRQIVEDMTHEERLKYAEKMNAAGMGMVVSGFGVFGGLCGGLWGSIGAGAIGAGFGASSGLWFGSCGPFQAAKEILVWDKEIEEGGVAAV
mmetsp:Transcript_20590/g.25340  ORF Transcript_20590/g.25340 Transcript_20590/m.25340 type:complete len:100 (+) Transcript_20590:257-556(+)